MTRNGINGRSDSMKIYLTLDYELFLGDKVGTVDNCLIKPTERLIGILNKYDAKATFFVDAAYLYRLCELKSDEQGLSADYDKIVQQLKWLVKNGHDMQLHIHPQWYNASYIEGKWQLTATYYKLSDLSEQDAYSLFRRSKDLLESITEKPVMAYRAGGYSIQTFQGVSRLFKEAGILVDSSALSKKKSPDGPQVYDYSRVAPGDIYRFNEDIATKEENGMFYELPITTCRQGFLSALKGTVEYHLTSTEIKRKYGDGQPVKGSSQKKKGIVAQLITDGKQWHPATIDNGGSHNLWNIYRKNYKANVFVIIGHPKNLSEYSLHNLEVFLKQKDLNNRIEVVSSIIER